MINEGKKILIKTNIHVISRSNEILGTDEISSKSEKNNPLPPIGTGSLGPRSSIGGRCLW